MPTRLSSLLKRNIAATLAKAKQIRDSFKTTMKASIEDLEHKGEGEIKSAKQQLERDWQEFEKAMDAAVVQLNNAGKEFEARAAAQLNSWQESIQKCNKIATGIAVEQKESFNAAIKRMQEERNRVRSNSLRFVWRHLPHPKDTAGR